MITMGISLTKENRDKLERLSIQKAMSMSEVIRDLIDNYEERYERTSY